MIRFDSHYSHYISCKVIKNDGCILVIAEPPNEARVGRQEEWAIMSSADCEFWYSDDILGHNDIKSLIFSRGVRFNHFHSLVQVCIMVRLGTALNI